MAEALRLASESRSTQAAARELGISPKLPVHRPVPSTGARAPALPHVARRDQRVLRLVPVAGPTRALRPGQPVHGYSLQSPRRPTRRTAEHEPVRQLLR